jgi:hypothetical protein
MNNYIEDETICSGVELIRSLGIKLGIYIMVGFPSETPEDLKKVDLILVGHTHGYQIHIPGMRPFWVSRYSSQYGNGFYRNQGQVMYISRGIGTVFMPIRFNCRPEITVLRLNPFKPLAHHGRNVYNTAKSAKAMMGTSKPLHAGSEPGRGESRVSQTG